MNILTIIVLAVIMISAIIGKKAGLIKTVFSMFSFIIALVLTVWISPFVSQVMQNNEKVVNYFSDKVYGALNLGEGDTVSDQTKFIEELSVPASFKDSLIKHNNADIYTALKVNEFKDYLSRSIACVIINAIAFAGTFLALILLLQLLCFILNIVSKLPILNGINTTAGMVAGALHGIIIIWILCIILTACSGTAWGQEALKSISESSILSFIYDNNLIIKYVTNLKKLL